MRCNFPVCRPNLFMVLMEHMLSHFVLSFHFFSLHPPCTPFPALFQSIPPSIFQIIFSVLAVHGHRRGKESGDTLPLQSHSTSDCTMLTFRHIPLVTWKLKFVRLRFANVPGRSITRQSWQEFALAVLWSSQNVYLSLNDYWKSFVFCTGLWGSWVYTAATRAPEIRYVPGQFGLNSLLSCLEAPIYLQKFCRRFRLLNGGLRLWKSSADVDSTTHG